MTHFTPSRLLSLLAVSAILFAVAGRGRVETAPPTGEASAKANVIEPNAKTASTPRLVGNASCAAAACHGGLSGHPTVGAEFPIWSARDPHSRAYSVLLNDLSQQMAKNLKLLQPAHESAVCLNCHSPAAATETAPDRERHPLDGVGCEQCHGAAEHWLTAHVRKDWRPRSVAEKQRLGYRDLTDVLTRAKLCADCHVGGPGRDVNHDLIAAGHPRLFFELSAFHANWPKHWPFEADAKRHSVAGDRGPGADQTSPTRKRGVEQGAEDRKQEPGSGKPTASYFEAKLWAVGQVVTAQRSLELLAQRAANAESTPAASWPELAEWNCFACHHDLQSASWRQTRTDLSRVKGSLVGNGWPYALIETLALETKQAKLVGENSQWRPLRSLIAKPVPPPVPILKHASTLAAELDEWAKQLNQRDAVSLHFSPAAIDHLKLTLAGDTGSKLIARDWDSATQLSLALNALHHASVASRTTTTSTEEQRDREIQLVLDSLNETLNFPQGFQSPRDFTDKPIERLQADLLRLRKLLTLPP